MVGSWAMFRNGGSLCLRFLCGCMFVGCWREECGGVCNLKIECYLIELKGNNLCWYYVIIIMLVRRVVARYDVAMVVLRKRNTINGDRRGIKNENEMVWFTRASWHHLLNVG